MRRQPHRAPRRVQGEHKLPERRQEVLAPEARRQRAGHPQTVQAQQEVHGGADQRDRRADRPGAGLSGAGRTRGRTDQEHSVKGQRQVHAKVRQHSAGEAGRVRRTRPDGERTLPGGPQQAGEGRGGAAARQRRRREGEIAASCAAGQPQPLPHPHTGEAEEEARTQARIQAGEAAARRRRQEGRRGQPQGRRQEEGKSPNLAYATHNIFLEKRTPT